VSLVKMETRMRLRKALIVCISEGIGDSEMSSDLAADVVPTKFRVVVVDAEHVDEVEC
jgi:hypothetical protein